jgi:PTS system nitrogen regulatory IIA component
MNGTCYGCGISLSTSLSAELFHFDRLYQCPNCSRFLYPYQGEKLNLHDDSIHHKLPRLGINKFSSARLMAPQLRADDKKGVITELAQLIGEQLYFPNADLLIDKSLKREAVVSTGVEHSLAFPHVRGIDAGCLTLALGLKKKGIKFGAPRDQLCKIFFFTIIPPAASAFYLTLLAGLIESLSSVENRKEILSCREPEELWETLKKLTKKHIP